MSEEISIAHEGPTLKRVVESIVFASQKPISAKEIVAAMKGAADAAKENPLIGAFSKVKESDVFDAISALSADYAAAGHAFEIRETVAGWQLVTTPAFAPWLRQLFPESKPARLSAPALETLAILAYRQPCTRSDLEAVRGVAVDGVMQTLLDRQLIRIAGRADIPGRPLLYETTSHFMEHFGLRNLDELPNAAELRRAAVAIAEANAPKAAEESKTADESNGASETAPAAVENAPTETTEAPAEAPEPPAAEGNDEPPAQAPESGADDLADPPESETMSQP
jgi:segregation and condensation protein B